MQRFIRSMHRHNVAGLVAAVAIGIVSLTIENFAGQRIRLPPVDEASSDSALKRTRDELLQAVRGRDVEGVMRRVHPDFMLDGQRKYPINRLRDTLVTGRPWHLDSSLWAVLERILSAGGAFTTTRGLELKRREFCAPYTFATLPRIVPAVLNSEVSPWVVTIDQAPLYRTPSSNGAVIATLSYDLVKAGSYLAPDGRLWYTVTLGDGRTGFVDPGVLRDPEDYHACFAEF